MVPSGPWEPGSLCPEPLTTLHLDDRGWGPDSAPSEQNWSLGVGQASDTLRAEAGPAGRRLPQEAHCVAGEHEGDGWGTLSGPCPDAPARLKICSLFRVSWLHSACRKWHQCTSVLHTRKTITPAPRAHTRVWTVSLCSPRDPWGAGLFLPQNPRPVSQCGRDQKTHGRLARQGPSSERPLSRESASPWRCRPPPLPQRGCLRRPPSAAPGGALHAEPARSASRDGPPPASAHAAPRVQGTGRAQHGMLQTWRVRAPHVPRPPLSREKERESWEAQRSTAGSSPAGCTLRHSTFPQTVNQGLSLCGAGVWLSATFWKLLSYFPKENFCIFPSAGVLTPQPVSLHP